MYLGLWNGEWLGLGVERRDRWSGSSVDVVRRRDLYWEGLPPHGPLPPLLHEAGREPPARLIRIWAALPDGTVAGDGPTTRSHTHTPPPLPRGLFPPPHFSESSRMPLTIHTNERTGKDQVVIFCDHCGKPIKDAKDGNFMFQSDSDANSNREPLFYTHKHCCQPFERARKGKNWGAHDLDLLPIFLIGALKVNYRNARFRAGLITSS